MKKQLNSIIICCFAYMAIFLAGCTPINNNYGSSSSEPNSIRSSYPSDIEIPTIKSTDTVMPLFFDISLYDEENYSQIYLGKKYKFNANYAGSSIRVPTTIKELNKKGWEISSEESYNSGSTLQAGSMLELQLVNRNNIFINAFFYNESTTSTKLLDCKIVRLAINENTELTGSPNYAEFSVNGITNSSAITDVIQLLGPPSHFHADTKTDYTLNWFKSKDDRRNKITVKISTDSDSVLYIAISNYQ